MFCPKCGKELPDGAKFCDACGAKLEAVENLETMEPEAMEQLKGQKVTPNIVLGTDGKYHWYYEFKLMQNPTILLLILKIFTWISVGIWAMLVIVDLIGGRMSWKTLWGTTELFLIGTGVLWAISFLGYFFYALLQGWKYCVMFEMDEDGVTHTQMPKEFKKAQAMAAVLVFMGVAARKPGAVGTGLLAGSRNSMTSSWNSVKSVEFIRKRDVIKVNERLNKNQVYALPEDYPFVEDFIRKHVSSKCSMFDEQVSL